MPRKSVEPCLGHGLVVRRLMLRSCDVVLFKGIVEASEGLAAVFAEHGGEIFVATPKGRENELDRFLTELSAEMSILKP